MAEIDSLRDEIGSLRTQLNELQQRGGEASGSQGQNSQSGQNGQPNQIAQPTANVYQVTEMVKMQAFYENDPELWFTVIESQFAARKITSERTRYLQVVANLNCTTASLVKDVIKSTFAEGHYDKLKTALIAIFAESSTEKFQKLISNTEIGEMKPSQFLHHMRSLADNTISEALVKQLWIQRLPTSSRAVLSASSDALDNLAKMADKMWEVSDRFSISSVNAENGEKSVIEKLTRALERLTNKVDALERKEHVSRRDNTPHRNRNRSSSRQSTKSGGKSEHELCWYHYKYGNEAKNCREPCKYTGKSKNE
ncbi:uncharacterized protein LOC129572124 [Sitodiplosis mosellana]|uniref:uncharacterized protein LOC129572124 n=1 Tax=Sitodiplosis mosellana TaxID=263140 RepID=UPI0024437732|nr:uncharacterized protein LOC129572124 [Sitodiplosis mosellana]